MEQKELNKILKQHKRWLQGEDGECANLRFTDLYRADLTWADLRRSNLRGANLAGANLCRADLRRSNLRGANLAGANLCRADLTEANLCRADLTEANLARADLRWANLAGANLAGADLAGANLSYVDFTEAIGLPVLSVQVNTSCKNRRITYIPSLDVVTAGCFQGTFEEFAERVEKEHKDNPFVLSRYRRVIAFLKREAEEDEKKLEQKD